ncbi:hypothetical protein [Massilia sp. CFBP9026]|uniref:hypothetical protein n=1 Tax=Massilia sp. CFBP9026 TaxID=3096536 RepID=UPI002A69A23B|nr:hypothetical protein [Massilia sp. CFBP9026]MDY0962619.1 hypothetical protein [Massilia sp. CFBP9026]
MKYALVTLLAAVLLGGCSVYGSGVDLSESTVVASPDVVEIQRVPFKVGVSSTTVEQLARAQACASEQGASLITEPGPIEVYRMQCQDGKVFMARCELRQCRKM